MRNLFLIIFTVMFGLLAGCSPQAENQSAPPTAQVQVDSPRVIAVLSYAEWCASCKILSPKVNKMRAEYEARGIEFVRLDYTDRDNSNFYAQAAARGFETPVRDYFGDNIITGRMMLMTPEGKMLTRPLNMTHSRMEIRNRLDKALSVAD
ncbi:thioredoxin domain-containing protein [Robiginitomaculum antarcticum]|uniref:thioredoxin domain-containing protein n=1 Tax=Robiginitomaculum antarcticum TaxID=437507 RepID=UPI00039C7C82|nr:thioredoxin domain-containing protein [Robiginitomaculum antarcticum]